MAHAIHKLKIVVHAVVPTVGPLEAKMHQARAKVRVFMGAWRGKIPNRTNKGASHKHDTRDEPRVENPTKAIHRWIERRTGRTDTRELTLTQNSVEHRSMAFYSKVSHLPPAPFYCLGQFLAFLRHLTGPRYPHGGQTNWMGKNAIGV